MKIRITFGQMDHDYIQTYVSLFSIVFLYFDVIHRQQMDKGSSVQKYIGDHGNATKFFKEVDSN